MKKLKGPKGWLIDSGLIPIRAASVPVTVEHDEGKPGLFSMVAYSGGLLPVKGYKFPVILDLQGV